MWREELLLFAGGFSHPAWGPAHSRRVYELAIHLAGRRSRPVDEGSLFAAAYLHDIAGLPFVLKAAVCGACQRTTDGRHNGRQRT